MEASVFTVVVIALKIAIISSFCPDASWLRIEKIANIQQNFPGTNVCIKGFSTPMSWQDATQTCRVFHGNLLTFDNDYRYGNGYAAFDYTEFWTGMYVTEDRFAVPLLDGVPPKRVNDTYYNRTPKTWQWVTGEPRSNHGCQMMTKGVGSHNASMVNCDRLLPFYCSAPTFFPYTTPLCLNGSLSAGLCYTVFRTAMTYNDSVSHCLKEGGAVAVFDNFNKDILSSAVMADRSFLNSDVRSYYLNGSSVDIGNDGSGEGGDINEPQQKLCFTLNMKDAYIEQLPCDTPIGVICQKPLTDPPPDDDDIPVLQIIKTVSKEREIHTVQCTLNRDLEDFESMVIFLDGLPENSNFILRNTPSAVITIPGSGLQAIGDYWCEIQNSRTSKVFVSDKVTYTFPQSSSLIYRGHVNFTIPPDGLTISLHNLQFVDDERYRQTGTFIPRILGTSISNGVQLIMTYQEAPLFLNQDLANGIFEIEKIREFGKSIDFSVYFKINTSLDPNWYTPEKDQFAMSRLGEEIKASLSFNEMPSKRRRKRQASMFLPDVVLLSTGSCSAFDVYDLDLERSISFGAVGVGDTAFSKEICITDKRPLAYVTCIGAFYRGASYGQITINRKCVFNITTTSNSTTTLQRLAEANVTGANTTDILEQTYNLTRVDNLTSLDVINTAYILTNVAESTDRVDQTGVEYATDIVNKMIGLDADILNQAQDSGSSTSRLVEALETISNNIVLDQTNSASIVRPFVASEIRQFSGDTNLVVGIQLKDTPEVTITNSSLSVLDDEMNLDIFVTDAAIILPKSILQSSTKTRLLLQIYSSTKLFNAISSKNRYRANSNIAAATLSQDLIKIENLGQEQVKTIFKPFKQTEGLVCGYWDYEKNDNSGGWSTDGCRLLNQDGDRAICVCDHLTNFAILIDFEAQGNYVKAHQLALSIITIVGLVLSIIGLSFTILCFIIFKPLRKTRGQKVLFQLAIAMLCSWVVFLAGIEQTSSYNGCIAVAILLHYLILVTFMWLLIEGFLQYLRFVKVLGTYIPRFMLKASIFAWGVPAIPVIVVCAIDYRLYDGGIYYCWMSLQPFYYAFAIPIGLVIFINIIVFILVIVNILRRPAGLQSNQSERKRALMNFWATISIFVLLGITWIFGYLAIEDARIPFQYIFTVCNAFQGFFIFLLFITRDPQVRKQWKDMCCKPPAKSGYYDVNTKSKGSSDLLEESHQTIPLTTQD
ncbi:uncharacterized protein LOC117317366 isoform X2 [Pecten maximus]|uniref:uncharacterized protein LOC117317366 isoform X2 n=1 Tax=Pecten maximus TaxID=6579 RepID=UPI0014583E0D|nr:uncharacterized protein LOC117317366 isoform X2 [Pecten maximus]